MCGYTRLDSIRNQVTGERVRVAPIEDKMSETRLRWYSHVKRISENALVRSCKMLNLRSVEDVEDNQ